MRSLRVTHIEYKQIFESKRTKCSTSETILGVYVEYMMKRLEFDGTIFLI